MPLTNPQSASTVDTTLPAGAIAQTHIYGRNGTFGASTAATGKLWLTGIRLMAGQTVTSITFGIGSTAMAGATHAWFALYNSALGLLGQSTDDTGTATWTGNTARTYSLSTPVLIATTGLYYVGGCLVATTMPTVIGTTPAAAFALTPPPVAGVSTTGLTGTAPPTAAALSISGFNAPYAYVS